MTPKEKAIELFNKFYYRLPSKMEDIDKILYSKQFSIIAVDEMTKYIPNIYHNDMYKEKYWKQVKKEIRKL